MKLPKPIELFHVPTKIYVESEVVDLTDEMIEQRIRDRWWDNSSIQPAIAALEIDRHWDWSGQEIEREGKIIAVAAELSLEAGFGGRLKLEASPAFVGWYEKRGLLEVTKGRIVHENTAYTPMELRMDRVLILLPDMIEEG